MPFIGYTDGGDRYTFRTDDGRDVTLAKTPASFLEAQRVGLLAQAGGASNAGGMSGGDPSQLRSEAPAQLSDAGGGMAVDQGAGGAPGYSAAPPREPAVSQAPLEPSGAGGAPQRLPSSEGSGGLGGSGPTRYVAPPPEAPPDGGGGAQGAPAAPPPAAPAQGQPGAAEAPAGPPKLMPFAGPAKPKGGGGGGGGMPAAQGPKEMLTGRQVTLEGKLSPETKAAQEKVLRDAADIEKLGQQRQLDREQLDREQADSIDKVGAHHDQQIRAARDEGQRILDDITARRQAKLAEIEAGAIDPGKFWQERSTGNTIGAALVIAFGAVGQALAGGKNLGLDAIEKAIDRDLDAQEKNLGKKQWEAGQLGALYAAEKERLGDKLLARNEAKIAALSMATKQAERLAKMQNSEDAWIKFRQIENMRDARIADLRAKNEDRIKEVQSYKTIVPAMGGAPKPKPANGYTIRDPATGRERFVEFAPGLSDGEKSEARKRAAAVNNWLWNTHRLEQGINAGIADSDFRAAAEGMTFSKDTAKGQGQSTKDSIESTENKVRGPGGGKAIQAYREDAWNTADELMRQYGRRPEE